MRGLVAAVAAGMVLAGCGGQHSTAPESTSSATVGWGASSSSQLPQTASQQQQINTWGRATGQTFISLGDAFQQLGDAMKEVDYSGMRAACSTIDENAATLSHALPSPDVGLTAALDGMVGDMRAATRMCAGFNDSTSGTEVREFNSTMDRAMSQFDVAQKILDNARG